ncbi:ribosome-inactivating protein lychnin-like [Silene latifolia]|uniref:ribosome-inactivating protein lychnin-like n=1 Tax=Silene latifolia TaxID=37657 RepID=UPI003D781485
MKMSSIWAWWLMMAVIVAAASAGPTWTVDSDDENYSSFLENLRKTFGAGTQKVCNISVTNSNSKSYVLVDLVFNGNTTTLAFRASDAYLVGYQDKDPKTKKLRANFFSDEYNALSGNYKSIFKDAADKSMLPCGSSYVDLVSKAGVPRANVRLGVPSLQTAIKLIYGVDFASKKQNVGKDVAKFALVAIQMVAEAARFKYIEDQVLYYGMYNSFEAGELITLLENNWSSLSNKYYKSCQPTDDRFTKQEMDLGLLLYKTLPGNSNDDHAALAFI